MPFELPIPSDLPSSFEGRHGYVRYWLECVLDVVGHAEQITKKAFTVITKYNLNTDVLADVSNTFFFSVLVVADVSNNLL